MLYTHIAVNQVITYHGISYRYDILIINSLVVTHSELNAVQVSYRQVHDCMNVNQIYIHNVMQFWLGGGTPNYIESMLSHAACDSWRHRAERMLHTSWCHILCHMTQWDFIFASVACGVCSTPSQIRCQIDCKGNSTHAIPCRGLTSKSHVMWCDHAHMPMYHIIAICTGNNHDCMGMAYRYIYIKITSM